MEVALLAAAIALIAAVLQPAGETVVVVPAADGHVGTVVVERDGERAVLNQAYAASHAPAGGGLHAYRMSESQVREQFGATLQAMPARPVSFQLYFDTGTDLLTEESRREFARMLEVLRQRPFFDIEVIGHTDRQGEAEANDQLSRQRAERVKADLVAQGVAPAERVHVSGRGEREPVVPTDDGADEPRNRRVEISVR